jgi:hypothetical protein
VGTRTVTLLRILGAWLVLSVPAALLIARGMRREP